MVAYKYGLEACVWNGLVSYIVIQSRLTCGCKQLHMMCQCKDCDEIPGRTAALTLTCHTESYCSAVWRLFTFSAWKESSPVVGSSVKRSVG